MPSPSTVRRPLVIEVCDLDTGERTRRAVDVDAPEDDPGRRAQMTTIVSRLHPNARMRSFGEGAASFLERGRLVVAHYGEPSEVSSPTPPDGGPAASLQSPLFAA